MERKDMKFGKLDREKRAKTRLIVFSIDGANWEIINYLLKVEKLPNFKKIMDNGVFGNLRSVNPPVTCPAWAVMFTGKNPASLGIYHFFKLDSDYELKLSKLKWKAWNPIWDIYSKLGKRVCVFNVPTTTAYEINGSFISGPIWGEDESLLAYPEPLNDELIRSGYKIRTQANSKVDGDRIYIEDIKEITERKFKIMYDFYRKYDWDLFIMAFYYCDQLQHAFWQMDDHDDSNNPIYDYYETLDNYLGKIITKQPENTSLIITSDHGLSRINTYFNLNGWLIKHGYLKIKQDYRIGKQNIARLGFFNLMSTILKLISVSYANIIHLSKLRHLSISKTLWEKLKNSAYVLENKKVRPLTHKLKDYADWGNTQAFSSIFNSIFLNMEDRYTSGSVPRQDYFKLRKRIIKELGAYKDYNTNRKVVKNIWPREEIYTDNVPDDFPDIVLELEDGYRNYITDVGDPREEFSNDPKGLAEHLLDGIFLATGPEILAGKKVNGARLEDIVPTILHINDIPIPSDIDGGVLKQIFKPDSAPARRAVNIKKAKKSEDFEREKLRSMKFSKRI